MELHETLHLVASRQYGLVSHAQLTELGVSGHRLSRMLRSGQVAPVRRGVYRVCGASPSWRSAAMAAHLAAGGETVLSHTSAGVLWGILEYRAHRGSIELTGPGYSRLEGVAYHRHALGSHERTVRDGIPVTTPARTLLDLSERFETEQFGRLIDDALRRRLVSLQGLRSLADDHAGRGRRRLRTVRAALADRLSGYDPGANKWEQKMDRLWDVWGLPPAKRQYTIDAGGHIYIPDRAIVDLKVAVDWNGYEYHGSRSGFDHDSRRRAELAAAGWCLLDFTSRSSPKLICDSVRAVVEQRRRFFALTAPEACPPAAGA